MSPIKKKGLDLLHLEKDDFVAVVAELRSILIDLVISL